MSQQTNDLEKDESLIDKKVQVSKIGNFTFIADVAEAYKDAKGTIQKIKVRKEDGFQWYDVGDSTVDVLNFTSKWVEWIWLIIRKQFVKKRAV